METQTDTTYNIQIPESKEPWLIIREYEEVREPEEWKDIPNAEGFEISSWGKYVRDGEEAPKSQNGKGYDQVHIVYNGDEPVHIRRKTILIYRLVADGFIENPNNLPCIDHKDRNIHNNYYKNLRRCTYTQNSLNRGAINGQRFKGVSHNRGSWQTRVRCGDISSEWHFSTSDVECAHWYDVKTKEMFNKDLDFLYLNFQDKSIQTY
jgi:hypothetical protein